MITRAASERIDGIDALNVRFPAGRTAIPESAGQPGELSGEYRQSLLFLVANNYSKQAEKVRLTSSKAFKIRGK